MDGICAISIPEIKETYPEISLEEAEQIQTMIVMMTDLFLDSLPSEAENQLEDKLLP